MLNSEFASWYDAYQDEIAYCFCQFGAPVVNGILKVNWCCEIGKRGPNMCKAR